MDSPVSLITGIIAYLIKSGLETLVEVLGFLGKFVHSLLPAGGLGLVPFLMAALVLGIVMILAWKFFVGSVKIIMLLVIAGLATLLVLSMLG